MEFAKAIAWISTAVAVIIGMKITESPWIVSIVIITEKVIYLTVVS